MISKTLTIAFAALSCLLAVSAAPLNTKSTSRQFTIPMDPTPEAAPIPATEPEVMGLADVPATPTPVSELEAVAPVADPAAPTPVTEPETLAPIADPAAPTPAVELAAPTPATEPEVLPAVAEPVVTPESGMVVDPAVETTPLIATETSDMGDAFAAGATPVATPEAATAVPGIYYNVGGATFGKFLADPIAYLVGETSAFEIPDAMIVGATPETADVYKSHRYGLLGSTWGYDIPVTTPGVYDCTLHYCETFSDFFTEEPNRTFLVQIVGDGAPVVHQAEFDVMVELQGAEFTAYDRPFPGIAAATMIAFRETPTIGDAFLSGISCEHVGPLETAAVTA